jgi:hypothetical protein
VLFDEHDGQPVCRLLQAGRSRPVPPVDPDQSMASGEPAEPVAPTIGIGV